MIVQELGRIQQHYGYLPRQELERLAERRSLPLYRIQEVVSFFPHFRTEPPPRVEAHICQDMSCRLRGSPQMIEELQREFAAAGPEKVRICPASCLGRCDRAPAAILHAHTAAPDAHAQPHGGGGANHGGQDAPHGEYGYFGRTADELRSAIRALLAGGPPQPPPDKDSELEDRSPGWAINVYHGVRRSDRYETVRQFVNMELLDATGKVGRERILAALERAGLLGMGGAGGRTYKKWTEVWEAQGDVKYVVCNGDESEPGTFKDRELLLRTPELVVEGVILAGLLLRARRGYLYIRHEYPEQIAALEREIRWAEEQGLCGTNILGSGLSFEVQVFVSPGGYICGEQTALIEAIEDKRAEPRNRPPELQTNGLWDMPTLLNNVETLAWAPAIVLREEGQWYASAGAKPGYRGRRFFSVSGDVARPGAYEVKVGIRLGDLIEQHCGGMRDGRPFRAIALSGPSGGIIPRYLPLESFPDKVRPKLTSGPQGVDVLDLELDIPLFRDLRLMMGAGIVVYGEGADLVDQVFACSDFFRRESCGKCVPCRIGSTKLTALAREIRDGELSTARAAALTGKQGPVAELAEAMSSTAICGLGTVAFQPLMTLLKHFPSEVEKRLAP